MKHLLAALLILLGVATFARAAQPALTVPQGGTGWSAIQAGAIPYGGSTLRVATTTQGTGGYVLAWISGVPTWVATTTFSGGLVYSAGNVTANCTAITGSADLCDGNDASGGGVWPFTPSTNYGVAVQATTTPIWLQNGLMASSTSYFGTLSTDGTVYVGTADGGNGGIYFGPDFGYNIYAETPAQGSGLTLTSKGTTTAFRLIGNTAATNQDVYISTVGLTSVPKTLTLPNLTGTFALGSYSTGYTSGSVPFGSSGLLATSSALYFDETGKRLAVGTSSPQSQAVLTLAATSTDASYSTPLSILNANRTEVFYIGEDGYTYQAGVTPYYDLYETDTAKYGGTYMSGGDLHLYAGGAAGDTITLDSSLVLGGSTLSLSGISLIGNLVPDSAASYDMGSNTLPWSGLYLGSSQCINFGAGGGTGTKCLIAESTSAVDTLLLQPNTTQSSGRVGIGTSTPFGSLAIATSTAPQLVLSSGAGSNMWAMRSVNGNFYLATSTVTATSTNPSFMIDSSGRLGIATSSPTSLLQMFSTATTTFSVDSNHATRGSCLELKDSDGVGYTYVTANNGVLTASTISCK